MKREFQKIYQLVVIPMFLALVPSSLIAKGLEHSDITAAKNNRIIFVGVTPDGTARLFTERTHHKFNFGSPKTLPLLDHAVRLIKGDRSKKSVQAAEPTVVFYTAPSCTFDSLSRLMAHFFARHDIRYFRFCRWDDTNKDPK